MPTDNFPSLISSLAIERFWDPPDFAGSGALFLLAPPRLEKFQVPLEALSRVIWGSSSSIPVMFSCLEKMSGITSTPTFNDFIVINGDLLKAGSSAMLTFSTPTLPLKSERLSSPSVTGRPKALVSSDSIFGRKLLMLMKSGSAIRITTTAATTIPAIFRVRLLNCIWFDRVLRSFKDACPHICLTSN